MIKNLYNINKIIIKQKILFLNSKINKYNYFINKNLVLNKYNVCITKPKNIKKNKKNNLMF